MSIIVGWETFRPVQLYGYFILFLGSLVYNEAFNLEPTLIKIETFLMVNLIR
jgi:hypothetical protein